MNARKLQAEGGALSMKFRTYTEAGDIAFDASVEERAQLIDFIDKSLATKQVDFESQYPGDLSQLMQIREIIAGQAGSDEEPLVMPRSAFWPLVRVASTWHFRGYDAVPEGVQLDVPKDVVESIRHVGEGVPDYIGLDT